MELKQTLDKGGNQVQETNYERSQVRSADGTTLQRGVVQPVQTAITDMHARNENNLDMEKECAVSKKDAEQLLHPKYLRHNLWHDDELFTASSAEWTHMAQPLPSPPPCELSNHVVMDTI